MTPKLPSSMPCYAPRRYRSRRDREAVYLSTLCRATVTRNRFDMANHFERPACSLFYKQTRERGDEGEWGSSICYPICFLHKFPSIEVLTIGSSAVRCAHSPGSTSRDALRNGPQSACANNPGLPATAAQTGERAERTRDSTHFWYELGDRS